jgi:hypothetical protein
MTKQRANRNKNSPAILLRRQGEAILIRLSFPIYIPAENFRAAQN